MATSHSTAVISADALTDNPMTASCPRPLSRRGDAYDGDRCKAAIDEAPANVSNGSKAAAPLRQLFVAHLAI